MADTKVTYKQSTGCLGIPSNGTTPVTVLTFDSGLLDPSGASGPGGIVDSVRVYNSDTVTHNVLLHLVPNGDSADVDTVIDRVSLQPKQAYRFIGPERATSQATIQMVLEEAHTSTAVYAKADVSQIVAA